jgi:hypothetical protein
MSHHLELNDVIEAKISPANYGRDQMGGGRRIATNYMVRLVCDRRWHRVFVCCISNVGTHYVDVAGVWYTISEYGDVAEMLQNLVGS